MYTVKMSAKGWVVIPKALRKKYNLQKTTRIEVIDVGGALVLVPIPEDPIHAMYGMFAGSPSLSEELLHERMREREREEHRA